MSSVIQAIWPPRVAVLFQFGRALPRNQRALSGKPMFWQPYRCTTPGCWPRGIAGVMDLLSAGGWVDLAPRSTTEPAALMSISRADELEFSYHISLHGRYKP